MADWQVFSADNSTEKSNGAETSMKTSYWGDKLWIKKQKNDWKPDLPKYNEKARRICWWYWERMVWAWMAFEKINMVY